jgi:beta-lactamase class A
MTPRTRLLALVTALLTGTTACSGASSANVASSGNVASAAKTAVPTAESQLRWIVAASRHLPVSEDDAKAHVAASTLTALGGAAGLTKALTRTGPLTAQRPPKASRTQAAGWFTGAQRASLYGFVATDADGLITGLYFTKEPGSWAELDTALHRLAPTVSFATAEIDRRGKCRVVHGVNAATPRPLGSAFKLYVLGALSDAVAGHKVTWQTPLAIKDAWKSLPSGVLQTKPAGTTLTLAQYADYMISISDNTAADHLIHRLGRRAVEKELSLLGNRHQRGDRPFLTTRQLFVLKGADYPKRANDYLALPRPARAKALPTLDAVPLSRFTMWRQPRDIDTIEWFAAPTDMCAAMSGLAARAARPGQSAVNTALTINDGGIGLDPTAYPTVWFKGGSEPGVLTLNYLARTSRGKTVVTSVMLSNPKTAFSGTTELDALAVARAGLRLSTGGTSGTAGTP